MASSEEEEEDDDDDDHDDELEASPVGCLGWCAASDASTLSLRAPRS